MDQGHYENPMAEIALALAMGFFAIMVLTMVSMGAGTGEATSPNERIAAAALRPASERDAEAATIETPSAESLVIYHGGRFLDSELQAIDPRVLAREQRGAPIVLAIAPSLPLAAAMEARSKIDREEVVITILDARWLRALGGSTR